MRIDQKVPPDITYGESIGVFLFKIGDIKCLTISEGVQREFKSCTPKVIIKFKINAVINNFKLIIQFIINNFKLSDSLQIKCPQKRTRN